MKSFARRNIVSMVLSILLILSLASLAQLRSSIQAAQFQVVGTYCSSVGPVDDAEYFVFDRDGEYYQYRQLTYLEKGTYSVDGTVVTLLKDEDKRYLIFSDKLLYCFDNEQNELTAYAKVSEVPTFINVSEWMEE